MTGLDSTTPKPWFGSIGRIVRLAIPISATRTGFFLMATVDTIMLGRMASIEQVAYYGIGIAPQFILLVVIVGFSTAIAILTAQTRGAGRPEDCGAIWRAGIWMGVLIGLAAVGAGQFGEEYLLITGQTTDLSTGGGLVLTALAWGMPALAIHFGTSLYLETIGEARFGFWTVVIGNIANAALNFWLLSDPATASADVAWATTAARWAMAGIAVFFLLVVSKKPEAIACRPGSRGPSTGSTPTRLIALGFPIVIQVFLETTSFAVMATFAGWAGTVPLASYQITLNFIAQTYMLAIGIGTAAAVTVGDATGRNDRHEARRCGWTATGLLLLVMMPSAVLAGFFPETLADLYIDDPGVKPMLVATLLMSSWVLIVDGLQGVIVGALRGAGDVKLPTWIALGSFWGVMVPAGWYFGIHLGMDAPGLLLGLGCGLGLAGISYCVRFYIATRG
ncbi:MAG: MATE family efflux transporter [Alphaproteobacteria bacterium]|nr:MATE family efflux transporter [Alphaproteobacteria bacterium]